MRKDVREAARDAAVATITALLQDGPKTVAEVYLALGGPKTTAANYMAFMHQKLRLIRRTGQFRNRGAVWMLGADPLVREPYDKRTRKSNARRDPLVAALFGMGQGALA